MLPFLVDDLELEKDFVSPPLDLEHVRVDRLKDGQRFSVLEPRLSNPDSLSKFSARDFQLQEILESGSYDLLQPVSPIKLSPLSSLDLAERSSYELDKYLSALSASQESPIVVDVQPKTTE